MLDRFLTTWKAEADATGRMIRAVPEDRADYRPHEKSMDAGETCRHIVASERAFVQMVLGEQADWEMPEGVWIGTALTDLHGQWQDALIERLKEKDDGWLAERVDFFGGAMARAEILDTMIRHTVHHRGQLSVYLRLMGEKVPGVYGPTADDQAPGV